VPPAPRRSTTQPGPPRSQERIEDPELAEIFLVEATDLFERIEGLVVRLGNGEPFNEVVPEVGRCLHTLKGAAGSVSLVDAAKSVHEMEDRLLAAGEADRGSLLGSLHEFLGDLERLFASLARNDAPRMSAPATARQEPLERATSSPSVLLDWEQVKPASPAPIIAPQSQVPGVKAEPLGEGPVRVAAEKIDELMDLASELITRRGFWTSQSASMKDFASQARMSRSRMHATADKVRDILARREVISADSRPSDVLDRDSELPELIRRIVEQAEDLAVLTESAQSLAKPLSDNCDALARLALTIWDSLQSIRILPVRGLFQRLTRVAQEAARVEGRQVEVVTVGDETGLDRAILDKSV
jgi:chemotaxis protein histidine kinase CheA